MLRSPLLPVISQGIAAMPPGQGFAVILRLISSMIAGVALCAARWPDGHPVKRCAHELVKVLPTLAERPGECRLENLLQVAEEVGAQIWHLVAFQSDQALKVHLAELVSSVCQPVRLVQENTALRICPKSR